VRLTVRAINIHPARYEDFRQLLREGIKYQVVDLEGNKELEPLERGADGYVIKHADLIPPKFDICGFVNSLERAGCREVVFVSRLGRHDKVVIMKTLKKLERDVELIRFFKNGRIERKFLRFQPYIFAYTGFKNRFKDGKELPIFALALLEGQYPRRIFVDKERADDLEFISETIKEHYREHGGEIEFWGKIKAYIYHNGFGETLNFDVNGNLIGKGPMFTENAYGLAVKGVTIE